MKERVIILVFFLVYSFIGYGQDVHFTQYYTMPLIFNPATTGFFDNNLRFSNNYRTQWSAINVPYESVSVAIDVPFKLGNKSKIGVGVLFINDNSSGTKLTVNKFLLSTTYILSLRNKHYISAGFQFGYIDKHFSLKGITLPSQYNSTTGFFDPDLPTNLQSNNTALGYFDLNIGIAYRGKTATTVPSLGLAIMHINSPKETFYDNNSKLKPRMQIHGEIDFSKENWHFIPHFFFTTTQKSEEMLIGVLAKRRLQTKIFKNIFVGISARTSFSNVDATMLTVGTNIYGFKLAVSYDFNISKLVQATNARGGFEISIIYELVFKKKILVTIPCDRY